MQLQIRLWQSQLREETKQRPWQHEYSDIHHACINDGSEDENRGEINASGRDAGPGLFEFSELASVQVRIVWYHTLMHVVSQIELGVYSIIK